MRMSDQPTNSTVPSSPDKEFLWIVLGLIMTAFRATSLLIVLLYPLFVFMDLEGATCHNFFEYHLTPYFVFYILTSIGCTANFYFMTRQEKTSFPRSKHGAYKFHRCYYRVVILVQILILAMYAVGCLDKSGLAPFMALILVAIILADVCLYGMIEAQQVPLPQVIYYPLNNSYE